MKNQIEFYKRGNLFKSEYLKKIILFIFIVMILELIYANLVYLAFTEYDFKKIKDSILGDYDYFRYILYPYFTVLFLLSSEVMYVIFRFSAYIERKTENHFLIIVNKSVFFINIFICLWLFWVFSTSGLFLNFNDKYSDTNELITNYIKNIDFLK